MADTDINTPHVLEVSIVCASAPGAYDMLQNLQRVLKVDPNVTSDDFEGDDTIIPVGTVIGLVTRSKDNPQQIGHARVVSPD